MVSLADVADLTGVTRPAVSNWRRRHRDFPEPVDESGAVALFALDDVREWLRAHGKRFDEPSLAQALWSLITGVRAEATLNDVVAHLLRFAALDTLAREPGGPRVTGPRAESDSRLPPDLFTPSGPDTHLPQHRQLVPLLREHGSAAVADGLIELAQWRQGRAAPWTATPTSVAALVAGMAGPVHGVVCDPAVGLGSMWLALDARPGTRFVGTECSPSVWRMAWHRMICHGVRGVEIHLGDGLGTAVAADLVVCEEPVRLPGVEWQNRVAQPRLWLDRVVSGLTPDGRAFHLSPAGATFRERDRKQREDLLRSGCVEAVVGLPVGLWPGTDTPFTLWCLRSRGGPDRPVLFVDASESASGAPDRKDLDPTAIDRITRCYHRWRAGEAPEEKGFAITVPVGEVIAARSNVRPSRWVEAVHDRIDMVRQAAETAKVAVRQMGRQEFANLPPLTSASRPERKTLDRLAREGELEILVSPHLSVREGSVGEYTAVVPDDLGAREVGRVSADDLGRDPVITRSGDVLVRAGTVRSVGMDRVGGRVPALSTTVLRVRSDRWPPLVLAALLAGPWNDRPGIRASLRDWEVPILGSDEITLLVDVLERHRAHREAAAALDDVRRLLVGAVGSGVRVGGTGELR